MKRFFQQLALLAGALIFVVGALADGERVLYRYRNSEGVQVINHTLPPEYAQKGYEVISYSGKLIKVVPPAPTAEELAQMAAEQRSARELAEWDARLRRRYSSVEDIESAKLRKLAGIDNDIAILKGNVAKLRGQLEKYQSQAAYSERAGREVPEAVLNNIANIEAEIHTREDTIERRKRERQELIDDYDRDIARFREITAEAEQAQQ